MQKPAVSGGIRLFQVFGITVFLHWSWFLIAYWDLKPSADGQTFLRSHYTSFGWCVAEFLSLFVIVLLHEFGHALACRSVGGIANRIMLWPFGGVAFVSPPPRPGAHLWSIAAGPLVNVVLIPVLLVARMAVRNVGGDWLVLTGAVLEMNIVLLVFNMLPIYPLDGGQILQSLLWFVIGRVRSLQVAVVVGVLGACAALYFAFVSGSTLLGMLALLGAFQCYAGWQFAARLRAFEQQPRHTGMGCPACGVSPPMGPFWRCPCGQAFDTFATGFTCPQCGRRHETVQCSSCGRKTQTAQWPRPMTPVTTPPAPVAPAGGQPS